jgi:hypothetical protein
MTPPRQDRAGQYIQSEGANLSGDLPPEKAIEIFLRCSALADQDFEECQTNQHKQQVWAALAASAIVCAGVNDGSYKAWQALFDALANTVGGRPGDYGLTSPISPSAKPINEEWKRACLIALLQRFPERESQILKEAKKELGLSKARAKKLCENFKQVGTGGKALADLVETAHSHIHEFGHKQLKDLI